MAEFRDGFYYEHNKTDLDVNESYLVVKTTGHSTVIWPQYPESEKNIQEFIDHINKGNNNVIAIMDDFAFLEACPNIRKLDVYPSFEAKPNVSMEGVYQLRRLKSLQVQTVYGFADKHKTVFDCSKSASAKNLNASVWIARRVC